MSSLTLRDGDATERVCEVVGSVCSPSYVADQFVRNLTIVPYASFLLPGCSCTLCITAWLLNALFGSNKTIASLYLPCNGVCCRRRRGLGWNSIVIMESPRISYMDTRIQRCKLRATRLR